jgi:hypothetical protein
LTIYFILFYLIYIIRNKKKKKTSSLAKNNFELDVQLINNDLIVKIEEFYEIYYINFWRLLIQIQLIKIIAGKHQESCQVIGFILNQILEISLKSDLVKKTVIEVKLFFSN